MTVLRSIVMRFQLLGDLPCAFRAIVPGVFASNARARAGSDEGGRADEAGELEGERGVFEGLVELRR
jgi:hypothetical protein